MIEALVPLARDLGIFAGFLALIGFLGKRWIDNYFNKQEQDFQREIDKEVQRFQAELEKELQKTQTEFDKEIHQVQSELEKEQVVFSDLHETRAGIISELYAKLNKLEKNLEEIPHPIRYDGDNFKEECRPAFKAYEDYKEYYEEKKIYFPRYICEISDEVIEKAEIVDIQTNIIDSNELPDSGRGINALIEDLQSLTEDEIPELRKELEVHFRELLGVETEVAADTEGSVYYS